MKHSGSCHCGTVKFEVEFEPKTATVCNCSICTKRGYWLDFVSEENFKLISGAEHLQDYQFNKHVLHHMFCRNCGVGAFTRGQAPNGAKIVALNLRCIEGIELDRLEIRHHDGKSL